jgi:hypothetical protein
MTGQINFEDNELGRYIVDICKYDDVKNIVEVGTWNGLGTTRCVIEGIRQSNKQDYRFISIECNKVMYDEAIINNKNNVCDNIKFIYGKIVDESVIDKWFDLSTLSQEQIGWLSQDIEWMKQVPNIIEYIPHKIDFLILDGGEFSTYPEWLILKDRVKYVALDDTTQLKCSKIREEILNNPSYTIIKDNINGSRYGMTIFKNINYEYE